MPYSIEALGNGEYRVINSKTGKIHSSHTTLEKANAQVRLLNGVMHGFVPTHNGISSLGQHTLNHYKKVASHHRSSSIR